MSVSILMAVGGTGGHLFPAERLADAVVGDKFFAGHGLSTNPYFTRKYPYRDIASGNPLLKNPVRAFLACLKLGIGCLQSLFLLWRLKPDVIVGFGSFHSFPVLFAARLMGKTYFLFEPNAVMGRVNRLFAQRAKVILSPFEHPFSHTLLTTLPLRKEAGSYDAALRYFGLEKGIPILLIFGGSQGAVTLNYLALEALKDTTWQILHFIGWKTPIDEVKEYYCSRGIRAVVKPFEEEIGKAMRIADIALCRGGSGTIAELIEHALPALLVPFPWETDGHQTANSRYFVDKIKGGLFAPQKELTPERLRFLLEELMEKKEVFRKTLQQSGWREPIETLFMDLL